MRILILSPFFHPEPISTGKYNSQLASALVDAGHEVEVVCSYPVYPTWVPEVISCDEIPGTQVIRGGLSVNYPSKALLRRAVLEVWYTWHVAKAFFQKAIKPDVIVCVFPPSLFSLVLPWFINKQVKIIGIVHDLQGVYVGRSGSFFGKIVKHIITGVEKKGFSLCNKLVFLSEEMLQWTVKNYSIDKTKTQVNYPFTTINTTQEKDPSSELRSIFPAGKKYIVYSGALGEKQNPAGLYDLLIEIVKKHPDWEARIFSQGPLFDQIKKTNQNSSIQLHPLASTQDLPYLLKYSDIQVVPQATGTSDGSLPSKLPNIIQSGTRLLCITDPDSELSRIVGKYTLGTVSTSWETLFCIKAFEKLAGKSAGSSENNAELLDLFSIDTLVKAIAVN